MRLAELVNELRDLSNRFGGISEALEAAERLEHAYSRFGAHQDEGTLTTLNGAYASAVRVSSWTKTKMKPEAV